MLKLLMVEMGMGILMEEEMKEGMVVLVRKKV